MKSLFDLKKEKKRKVRGKNNFIGCVRKMAVILTQGWKVRDLMVQRPFIRLHQTAKKKEKQVV